MMKREQGINFTVLWFVILASSTLPISGAFWKLLSDPIPIPSLFSLCMPPVLCANKHSS